MEAVILAGGLGTRLSEETTLKPKPMVSIGRYPILIHIMNYLSKFGIKDFIICLGYKGEYIKQYFLNELHTMGDLEIDFSRNKIKKLSNKNLDWNVKLIETGELNMTGSRLYQAIEYVNGDSFLFTYGDGLTNQDISKLIDSHTKSGKIATVTAVQPPGRFGSLNIDTFSPDSLNIVKSFTEKPLGDNNWINGGYFILNKKVKNFLNSEENLVWEKEPLNQLANDSELNAFVHRDFWKPMDTLKDKMHLEKLVEEKKAPWIDY